MYRVDFANIEITNICNFKCGFCPQSILKRKPATMPLEMIKGIMEEMGRENLARRVHLHLMGEPTLHKDFDLIIKYADELNLGVTLLTNGSNLSEERINSLLSLRNLEICISMRTLNEMPFNINQYPITLENYLKNIKKLITTSFRRQSNIPIVLKVFKNTFYSYLLRNVLDCGSYINISFLHNFFKDIYQELGINRGLYIKHGGFTLYDRTEVLKNIFLDCEMLIHWDSEEMRNGKYYNAIFGNCVGLKNSFAILVDGNVTPCCRDYNGEVVLGNIKNHSLKDILNGDRAKFIRSSLNRFKLPTEFCKRCKGGPTMSTSLINQLASTLGICKLHNYIEPLNLPTKS